MYCRKNNPGLNILIPLNRAGVTDSALTNHGMAQIDRLAEHIASDKVCESSRITHIFSSDLQRARITAEGICSTLPSKSTAMPLRPVLKETLRERDFGAMEGMPSIESYELSHPRPENEIFEKWKDCESESSMRLRVENFFNEHLQPMIGLNSDYYDREQVVIVVAHGIILRVLWAYLLEIFSPENVSFDIDDHSNWPRDTCRPPWSNTGFLSLFIASSVPKSETSTLSQMHGWYMKVQAFNYTAHLNGLRRTRGGIGSAMHDTKQKQIKDFFR